MKNSKVSLKESKRRDRAQKIRYVAIVVLALFFVLLGVRIAPSISMFMVFNMDVEELLAEAKTSGEGERVMVARNDIQTYAIGVKDLEGLVINGQKFAVTKATALDELQAIVYSEFVYLYASKNPKYSSMSAICFGMEGVVPFCLAAVNDGEIGFVDQLGWYIETVSASRYLVLNVKYNPYLSTETASVQEAMEYRGKYLRLNKGYFAPKQWSRCA